MNDEKRGPGRPRKQADFVGPSQAPDIIDGVLANREDTDRLGRVGDRVKLPDNASVSIPEASIDESPPEATVPGAEVTYQTLSPTGRWKKVVRR